MKKLLALLGSVMMIGSSATAVISCAGTMESKTLSFGTVSDQSDYDLWQGTKTGDMENTIGGFPTPETSESNAKTLTTAYLRHDKDGKIRDQINQALLANAAFPKDIDENYINRNYLSWYFLPMLTNQLAAHKYSPVAYINPAFFHQLEHWNHRDGLTEANHVWIDSLYKYWVFRKERTNLTYSTFREIMLYNQNQAEELYREALTLNTTNFQKHEQIWSQCAAIIQNNDNILPPDFNMNALTEYLHGYLLPWISLMAWDVNHRGTKTTILFDRDQNGQPWKNPVDFKQLADETLAHMSAVLKTNILLNRTFRWWLNDALHYLAIGLSRPSW